MDDILNQLDSLSIEELEIVLRRGNFLLDKKKREEAQRLIREQELIRQEKIAQEKARQEEIAELQRKLVELQNQKIEIPEEPKRVTGESFVMYVMDEDKKQESAPAEAPKAAPVEAPKPKEISCPNCHQMNSAESLFCLKCGTKLSQPQVQQKAEPVQKPNEISCPNCHQMNSPESAFCLKCGTRLSQPQVQHQPQAPVYTAPAPAPNQNISAAQVKYSDGSLNKWEMLPGEKTVRGRHDITLIQPEPEKKFAYTMEITDKRLLLSRESSASKNATLALSMGGGLVGSLIANGVKAANGSGPKPYIEIPLSAITNCGLQSKKEFFVVAGETFVFKNSSYDKLIPELVKEAKA